MTREEIKEFRELNERCATLLGYEWKDLGCPAKPVNTVNTNDEHKKIDPNMAQGLAGKAAYGEAQAYAGLGGHGAYPQAKERDKWQKECFALRDANTTFRAERDAAVNERIAAVAARDTWEWQRNNAYERIKVLEGALGDAQRRIERLEAERTDPADAELLAALRKFLKKC